MRFADPEYYEHTRFDEEAFPFHCFPIVNSDTLPHWHNHLELILSSKGTSDVFINGVRYTFYQYDILVVPPGGLHSIHVRNSDYIAVVVGDLLLSSMAHDPHVSHLVLPFFAADAFLPLHIRPDCSAYAEVKPMLDKLIFEEAKKEVGFEAIIKAQLCMLFGALMRCYPNRFTWQQGMLNPSTKMIKKTLEYISMHYTEKITLADMGKMVNLSLQHFSRLFKAYTGKTLIDYLTFLRLEQARFLLTTTTLPITIIPERTGFCNSNYFSRVFRKYYGMTPSAARSRNAHTKSSHITDTALN